MTTKTQTTKTTMQQAEYEVQPVRERKQQQREIPTPRQGGFTLVEIMVVIVILGLLAGIVAPAVLGRQAEAEEQTARNDIGSLMDAVTIYVMKNRRLPTLDELVTPDEKGETYLRNMTEAPKDPWGTPYEIRQGDRLSQFEIMSYGPDRQEGTEDDISSKTLKDRAERR